MRTAERVAEALRQEEQGGLVRSLPPVRGKIRAGAALSKINWFQVGGAAEVLFRPEDVHDLAGFLAALPREVPRLVLGVGSNLLVRDGGVAGVAIRLGRGFSEVMVEDGRLAAGASALSMNVAHVAAEHALAGLEFFSGIPGTIGGALAMNAGAYGRETAEVLEEVEMVDPEGGIHRLRREELEYGYRHCAFPPGWIFTRAWLRGAPGERAAVLAAIGHITRQREATQPIRARTGGSTFKNPPEHKAWQLIDAAGCRGLTIGAAQISEKHCNFMINTGGATAAELEALGEEVRMRVQEHSGMTLEWEIKRVGDAL